MSENTHAEARPGPGKLVQWLPMIVLQIYLGTTVFLFAFGPWPWPVYSPTTLYTFLAFAHTALLLGYAFAIGDRPASGMSKARMRNLFFWSIALNILFIFPTAKARTGAWIPDVGAALADPGVAYDASLDLRASHTGVVEYGRVLLGYILFLSLPWALYYWKSLSRLIKITMLVWLALWISIALGMGTRKVLADILIVSPWMLIAGHYSGNSRWSRAAARIPIVLGFGAIFGFLQFFGNGQIERQGSGAVHGTFGGLPITADFEHWMVSGLSPIMKVVVTQLDLYVTQGYYALGLALEKPWVPMFGVGHSAFLFRNVARSFGLPGIGELPYPVRVFAADGWDHLRLWDTIYPWLASDLSFPGVIVAMFVIGWLLARSWKDALGGRNPLAVAVVALLLVLGFYIPANNQCCQDGEGFTSFYILIFAWLLTRRKFESGDAGDQTTIDSPPAEAA